MILEVQIQNFWAIARSARRRTGVKVFIFEKFQGAQISIFFCENWYEASSYNIEQTQKYEFEIWVSKLFYFHPRKSVFLIFKEKHPIFFFFVFRLWFSLKNNKHKIVMLFGIFENAPKKI